jgi:signal peptidase II
VQALTHSLAPLIRRSNVAGLRACPRGQRRTIISYLRLPLSRQMRRKYTLLLITVGAVVLCDQVTKLYVDAVMWPHQSITVIENYFDITYVRNPGGAFGLFAKAGRGIVRPLLLGLTAVAVVILFLMYRSTLPDRLLVRLAFSLIIGGAVGNLIDRLRFDEVIDFLDVHWSHYHWPAFNIADAAITVGVAILCWDLLFGKAAKQ